MRDFNNIQRKHKKKIWWTIAICVLFLTMGGVGDWLVSKGSILRAVENLNAFSMAALQIQAAVTAFSFATIVLLSGNTGESYMGTAVIDYYLNIRPSPFTALRIMLFCIALLALNCFFHLLGWYNLVLMALLVALFLIGLLLYETYVGFSGDTMLREEIDSYVTFYLRLAEGSDDKGWENLCGWLSALTEDWCAAVPQNMPEFNRYKDFYQSAVNTLLKRAYPKNGDSDSSAKIMEHIQRSAYRIARALLTSEKAMGRIQGIQFVQAVYQILEKFGEKNSDRTACASAEFTLFQQIHEDLFWAIKKLSVEDIEREFRIEGFLLFTQSVAFLYGKGQNRNKEMECLRNFLRSVGKHLSLQNGLYTVYWPFKGLSFDGFSLFDNQRIPFERQNDFYRCSVNALLAYFTALVDNGAFDALEWFYRFIEPMQGKHYPYVTYLALAAHGGLYYLATGLHTKDTERENANKILDNPNVKEAFRAFALQIPDDIWNESVMQSALRGNIWRGGVMQLTSFAEENFPEKEALREFLLLLGLYRSCKDDKSGMLEAMTIPDNFYRKYGFECQNTQWGWFNIEPCFKKFLKIIGERSWGTPVNEGQLCQAMMAFFQGRLKTEWKTEAFEARKRFSDEQAEFLQKQANERIRRELERRFAPVMREIPQNAAEGECPKVNYRWQVLEISVADLQTPVSLLLNKSTALDGYAESAATRFAEGIMRFLDENHVCELLTHSEDNDMEYLNALKSGDIRVFIGSKSLCKSCHFENDNAFSEFANEAEWIECQLIPTCLPDFPCNTVGLGTRKYGIIISLSEVTTKIRYLSPEEIIKEAKSNVTDKNGDAEYVKIGNKGEYLYYRPQYMEVAFEEKEWIQFYQAYQEKCVSQVRAQIGFAVTGTKLLKKAQ